MYSLGTKIAAAFLLVAVLQPVVSARPRHSRRHLNKRERRTAKHLGIRVHVAGGPWTASTFADSAGGDRTDGDDPFVRYAAVHALGPFNGTIVVADPQSGRILTVVNQKLAMDAFQPCSTIKLVTATGALTENLIQADTEVQTGRRRRMGLTEALAHSSNRFFARFGGELGFDGILRYARMFGIGEPSGINLPDEMPEPLPDAPPSPEQGGVGMMSTFGVGIAVTPMEMTAIISAIANGGTLYYLQYPRTADEIAHFTPRVKRQLEIGGFDNEIKAGLAAAVENGTARGTTNGVDTPVFGKTGTCTDDRFATHLGWFASFNKSEGHSIAVVTLLTGGQPVHGGLAASIAGALYRTLSEGKYFEKGPGPLMARK